jgi:nitrogen PTS system EIIA component
MNMSDIIGPQQVLAKVRASDKAQLLHELARRAAQALGLDIRAILDPLLAREQLGSTGVGSGIALPHAKVTGLDRAPRCRRRGCALPRPRRCWFSTDG